MGEFVELLWLLRRNGYEYNVRDNFFWDAPEIDVYTPDGHTLAEIIFHSNIGEGGGLLEFQDDADADITIKANEHVAFTAQEIYTILKNV